SDLCRGHGRGQPCHEAQAGCRIDWPGLRLDRNSTGGACFGFPAAGFLGGGCGHCVCDFEHRFLVGGSDEVWWFHVDMVFYWLVDAGEWRIDLRHRRVRTRVSAGEPGCALWFARPHLVGRLVVPSGSLLLLPVFAMA